MTQRYKGKNGGHLSTPISTAATVAPEWAPQPLSVQQVLAHGEDAARALENPVVQIAWSRMIQGLTQQWMECGPEEKQKQADLHALMRLSAMFKDILVNYAEHAKYEHAQLLQREQAQHSAMQAGVSQHEI